MNNNQNISEFCCFAMDKVPKRWRVQIKFMGSFVYECNDISLRVFLPIMVPHLLRLRLKIWPTFSRGRDNCRCLPACIDGSLVFHLLCTKSPRTRGHAVWVACLCILSYFDYEVIWVVCLFVVCVFVGEG